MLIVGLPHFLNAEVLNKVESKDAVLLTFDACETKTPVFFDEKILDFIVKNKIPVTIFVNKKFAERNIERLIEISKYNFIEIENHSANHYQYMQRLDNQTIVNEVKENEKYLYDMLGIKTKYFRFPGFNYDVRGLKVVESLGYKVVHANLISGDPDKNVSAEKMYNYISKKIRPGDIIIFHINGRGYNTHEALPKIYESLKSKGLRPALLSELIN
ncbi:polysaccharide deacetylase family protein [Deferribacteraceae bacterium V6Fe1]|nr:polysaccharide deacetylase family protein [Deferribacteraceae bacterium V6Fe1]